MQARHVPVPGEEPEGLHDAVGLLQARLQGAGRPGRRGVNGQRPAGGAGPEPGPAVAPARWARQRDQVTEVASEKAPA